MRTGALIAAAAAFLAACASGGGVGGPRPPQGFGPAGTNFGNWNRDAEGAVDQTFRRFITERYSSGDWAKARVDLEADGFTCQDSNRPDGRPVPELDCIRLYRLNDDIHAWTVQFWPERPQPEARYTRTHRRDPFRTYDADKHN
ncbi:MAG: hypothetical protein R3C52_13900 [Hyphomonadaceae bacterium]